MSAINSGYIIRALPRTSYDFLRIAGGTFTFPLVQHVSAADFTEATWMIRVHSGSVGGASSSLTFTAIVEGYDFGDPAVVFRKTGGTLVIGSGTSLPYYNVLAAPTGAWRLLRLDLTATQPATPAALNAIISVDLSLKGGDGPLVVAPNQHIGYGVQ